MPASSLLLSLLSLLLLLLFLFLFLLFLCFVAPFVPSSIVVLLIVSSMLMVAVAV